MKIQAYSVKGDPETMGFELNEGYFRFNHNLYLRVDDQGDNNENELSAEQKMLIAKLMEIGREENIFFKKILFSQNEIVITFLTPWDDHLRERVENSIRWSWPQFFLNLNP